MVKKAIVTVNEGKVCGIKTTSSFSGTEYYAFYGIPYGQCTSYPARFKDPVKVKPWKNVYDATTQKEGCLQFSLRRQEFSGTEDCLYNNVYTPELPSKDDTLKSVVVCVHPGGYLHGSPDPWCYGAPDYVMNKDIVYVCVGYRLHILGFLNLELEECSGNQGLKDVILSLKWIKENITTFGGDPSNVTLLGSSSGSTLVQALMISPSARGLFHKAVMMGLYIFDPTLAHVEDQLPWAYRLARKMGYNGTNPNDKKSLLMFLKKIKIQDMIHYKPGKDWLEALVTIYPTSPFVPTVDKGENAVLPSTPKELLATMPPIPLIFGMCEKEAAMAFTRPLYKYTMKNFNTAYLQNGWGWGSGLGKEEVDVISERVRAFYCNGQPVEKAPMNLQIDILTDAAFSDVYDTVIDLVSADLPSSVFVYKFQFQGNACTMTDKLADSLQDRLQGTCHAADFSYWAYIFDHWGVKTDTLNAKSAATVEIFTNLISTFAKTGDPNYDGLNVVWKSTTPENRCYLSIDDTLQLVDGKLNGKRMEFWENIKKEFRKS